MWMFALPATASIAELPVSPDVAVAHFPPLIIRQMKRSEPTSRVRLSLRLFNTSSRRPPMKMRE